MSAIDSFKFVLGECFETSLPISGLFLFEGLAVNLGFFPRSVENGIVAISHVFRPCQFSKRRILTLTDMVQIRSHLLGRTTLSGAAAQAADLNGDGELTLTDFVQSLSAVLGRTKIKPN